MKYNLSKTGLVVIVAVLALALFLSGCTTASNSKVPGFIEVGADYYARCSGGEGLSFKVLEIRDDGWILVERVGTEFWVNTSQLTRIEKERKPE